MKKAFILITMAVLLVAGYFFGYEQGKRSHAKNDSERKYGVVCVDKKGNTKALYEDGVLVALDRQSAIKIAAAEYRTDERISAMEADKYNEEDYEWKDCGTFGQNQSAILPLSNTEKLYPACESVKDDPKQYIECVNATNDVYARCTRNGKYFAFCIEPENKETGFMSIFGNKNTGKWTRFPSIDSAKAALATKICASTMIMEDCVPIDSSDYRFD